MQHTAASLHLSSGEYWCYIVDMTQRPGTLSLAPELPFKYVGGDPAIDLVNTVDWTPRGLVDERLTDYDRLTRWADGAGVITSRLAAQLRTLAAEHPRVAERAHRDVLDLRWQLRQLFEAVTQGETLAGLPALGQLNETLADAQSRLELAVPSRAARGESALRWSWREADERLDAILWPVGRAAAELLVSDEASRIRECGGEDCGWMYVDRSRNGLRRWCQMEVCGTREKSRQRALRRVDAN